MQTFDQSIFDLDSKAPLRSKRRSAGPHIEEFQLKVREIASTAATARDEMARKSGVGHPDIIRFGG